MELCCCLGRWGRNPCLWTMPGRTRTVTKSTAEDAQDDRPRRLHSQRRPHKHRAKSQTVRRRAAWYLWGRCAELRARQLPRPCSGSVFVCSDESEEVSTAGAVRRRQMGRLQPIPRGTQVITQGTIVRALVYPEWDGGHSRACNTERT